MINSVIIYRAPSYIGGKNAGLDFLGSIPFDLRVVASGDSGVPVMLNDQENEFTQAFATVVDNIIKAL